MSAFYWVLYIFIAVVALLCITAFVMYMCRLCTKSKDFDEEAFFTASGRGLDLNSTDTTQLMNETSANRAGTSGTSVELVNVRRKVEQYEQNHEVDGEIEVAQNVPRLPPQQPLSSYRDHGVKPPVAQRPLSIVKPPIANKPGGGVTKPSNLPPPPPPAAQNNVQTAIVVPQHQQKTVVLKPKSAPPPPPPQNSAHENTDGYRTKKRSAPQPPQAALRASSGHESPPTYDDVMLHIPVDDYLTDNDN